MSLSNADRTTSRRTLNELPPHTPHQCRSAQEFRAQFEAQVGYPVQHVADSLIAPEAQKAIFLVGSLTLGMGTDTSDADFIVLVDDQEALLGREARLAANSDTRLVFSNANDTLVACTSIELTNCVAVEVQPVMTSSIRRLRDRLKHANPGLSDNEIKTLSRLNNGWLLWQSEGYLERNSIVFPDPVLDTYCSVKNFLSALDFLQSACTALNLADIPLSLHLGRLGVEMGYLAYFASEGHSYLGRKWLAKIGYAADAAEPASVQPLLRQSLALLFPSGKSTAGDVTRYLQAVAEFLAAVRRLIEQKTPLHNAFSACPPQARPMDLEPHFTTTQGYSQ